MLYLDHNSTSPLRASVRARMHAALDTDFGNPGSTHRAGRDARVRVERARRALRRVIGGEDGDVVFCASATEANNLALLGSTQSGRVVASRLEHASVMRTIEAMALRGTAIAWIDNDELGRVDVEQIEREIRSGDVGCVTLMLANNELGNLNPIAEVAQICAEEGLSFHVDAAQVVGRYPWVVPPGVTSATISGHKAGGPLGVGALWLARGQRLAPVLFGGAQERGWRPGTENVVVIDGFAALLEDVDDSKWGDLARVRDAFEDRLLSGAEGIRNGDVDHRMPNTSNVSFPAYEAEEILMSFDLAGIAASAGSACTAGSIEVSHVIRTLGLPSPRTASAIRFSFGPEHVAADGYALADRVLAALPAR